MLLIGSFQVPGEGAQAAVGGGADGSGSFAQDVAGGLGVQAEDGAEQDGFGLVGGQGGDQVDGGAGGQVVQGGWGGVVGAGDGGQVLGGDGDRGRTAAAVAQVVQGAVPGDGGGPAAEGVVGSGEAGQVAQQPGLDVAVQAAERVRVALLGPPHHPRHLHGSELRRSASCPVLRRPH